MNKKYTILNKAFIKIGGKNMSTKNHKSELENKMSLPRAKNN